MGSSKNHRCYNIKLVFLEKVNLQHTATQSKRFLLSLYSFEVLPNRSEKHTRNLTGDLGISKKKFPEKDTELTGNLPLLICECGAKILLLPDLKVMNHAIEVHVAEHIRSVNEGCKKNEIAAHVRQVLTEQLFEKAGKTEE